VNGSSVYTRSQSVLFKLQSFIAIIDLLTFLKGIFCTKVVLIELIKLNFLFLRLIVLQILCCVLSCANSVTCNTTVNCNEAWDSYHPCSNTTPSHSLSPLLFSPAPPLLAPTRSAPTVGSWVTPKFFDTYFKHNYCWYQ
jgi:hypothetical protein